MKTIALFNVKGGVGKTCSAITISHILASVYKKRVLIVDLDPQSDSTDFYKRYDDNKLSVQHVLTGRKTIDYGKDIPISIEDIIVHTEFENLDILPANLSLGRAEKELVSDVSIPQQFRLKNQLKKIEHDYDYIIIDCSPSAESLVNTNGLAISDAVFVPLKCDKWATRGLNATIQVIDTISTYNYNLKFGGCFFVQWENRNVNKAVYESLKDSLGDKMLDQKIRKNKSVEEITYNNTPLMLYDKDGTATQDYQNLVETILKIV